MPKVVVIILNYKVKDLTLKAIISVKGSTFKNLEIIVVDNNSHDGLANTLVNRQDLTFIQNDENLGYCGGNNVGIAQALKDGADWVFILNPDAQVDKDAIKNLVEVAQKENIGIAGPKVLFTDRKTIWYAGGVFDTGNVLGTHRGVDEKDHGQYNVVTQTDFVTGAAIFIRRDVLEKVGLFDTRYFLYYEDSDFCFRAKKAGFKIMFVPEAVVYHLNAQSTKLGSPLQDYYITRNRMIFAAKFLTFRARAALFREGLRNLGSSVRRLAFFDFLVGRFGKGGI